MAAPPPQPQSGPGRSRPGRFKTRLSPEPLKSVRSDRVTPAISENVKPRPISKRRKSVPSRFRISTVAHPDALLAATILDVLWGDEHQPDAKTANSSKLAVQKSTASKVIVSAGKSFLSAEGSRLPALKRNPAADSSRVDLNNQKEKRANDET